MNALPRIEALDLRPTTTEAASPDEYVWDWPTPPTFTTAAPAPAQEAGDGRGQEVKCSEDSAR